MNWALYKNTMRDCAHFTTEYLRINKIKDLLKFTEVEVLQIVFKTSFSNAKALVFYIPLPHWQGWTGCCTKDNSWAPLQSNVQ